MVTSVKSNSPSVQPASPITSGPASQESGSRSGSPIQSTSPRSESPTGLQSRQQEQSLAGGGPASSLAGGGPASSLAGGNPASSLAGGDPANEGIQQGAVVGPNNVSTDPQTRMRNAAARLKERPLSAAAQSEGNEASQSYKRRKTTFADVAAIGNQGLATATGSSAAFGLRGAANSLVDTAAKASIPGPHGAAAGAIVKYFAGTAAAAVGTQLNEAKIAPYLDQNTGVRHVPTPISAILPDDRREALNGFKANYGDDMKVDIISKQEKAGTPQTLVGALAYGTGAFGATVAQSFVTNPIAKAAIVAGGPTVGGAILGATTGYQKATATYNAPTEQGITNLRNRVAERDANNDPYDSDGMNDQLKRIETQPHNLYYTDNPSADTKADALAEEAANRPRTGEGIFKSFVHRAVALERDLRVANGAEGTGTAGGHYYETAFGPLAGTLATASANGVGMAASVMSGLLKTTEGFPENDADIAETEIPRAHVYEPAPEDLAEQGGTQL
jgi:hypothetical protein